jgi:circadian clock protein KaiC
MESEEKSKHEEKIPSGIEGLDDLLGGGFPPGKNIVLSGIPGSGKTILCSSFINKGIKECGESAIYITLEESPEGIIQNMEKFGINLREAVQENKLVFVDANPVRGEVAITSTGQHVGFTEFKAYSLSEMIRQRAREINAKRVVVDPLTALLMHYRDEFQKRLEVARLLIGISELDCTVLLTTEHKSYALSNQFLVEHFIADGVVMMDMLPIGGGMVRGIQIQKLRGAKHDFDYHLYHINERGITVFPKERIFINKTQNSQ